MSDLVLNNITSGYNLSLINSNFQAIQDKINNFCLQTSQGDNVMSQDLDMNSFSILNMMTNFSNIGSMLTVGDAKSHFYQIGLVPNTTNDTDAVNYGQVSQMIEAANVGTDPANVALYSELEKSTGASLIGSSTGETVEERLEGAEAIAGSLAGSNGSSLVGYLTGTVKSFLDGLAGNLGATFIKYKASWTGAIQRTLGSVAEDQVNSAWFGPDDTGATDASAKLQMAIDAAEGKTLFIKPGTYLLGSTLLVSSNTTIEAYGCTFYRIGALDNLLRNKADGTTGGYAANGGITILGGTWDSINGAGAPSNVCTVMAFGHCNNVKVIGAVFFNENAWHHIEFNSTSNATVRDCSFSGGYASASQFNEAIQIDSMDTSTQFPWFGPYDNTVCSNIKIVNNRFQNIGSGVGNHTDPALSNHSDILVDGNLFTNVYYACVKPLGCSSLRVVNNRGESIALGVYVQSGARVANDVTIANNTWYHIGYGTYTGDSRAVRVLGNATGYCKNLVISGNKVLDVRGTAGTHGISADMAQLVTISGNTVEDTNRSGIYVFGGKYVTVTGNVVRLENGASLGYEGIRLGTNTAGDSDRFNVEGNYCNKLGSYALNNSLIRNNNIETSATHSGNTATNTLDNLVGTTFTAG